MEKENLTVKLSVEEYQGMIREEELLKETLRNQSDDLSEAKDDLDEVKKAEAAADLCIETLKNILSHWLSKKNEAYVNRLLGFYDKDRQVIFLQAILEYLLFGVKPNLPTEPLRVHFKYICDRLDEDATTLPAHSLMVKLIKKYGLIKKVF